MVVFSGSLSRRLARGLLVGIGSVAVQLTAVILGLAGLAGAAIVAAIPWVFITVGLVVYAGAVSVMLWVATRNLSSERRRSWLITAGAFSAPLIVSFTITVLLPVGDPPSTPDRAEDMGWWELSDGSRIAFTHTASDRRENRHPVVFVHGGPAVADLAGDTASFGRLARDGHDVYVYDQLGTGRSSRLHDPSGYTLDRWAGDLEEIRHFIGAEKMVLIAHSWGARIATRYLERHPERVSALILSSPGAIPGSEDDSGAGLVSSLPESDRRRVLSLITHPRMLTSYGLLQINPRASRNFTPDTEMDARFDRVYNASRAAYHCPGQGPGPELHGLGFYAYQYPQSVRSPADPDIRDALKGHRVPTLVVKGQCDYLSWASAVEYVEVLADTTLVYLEDAGHNVYQDRPEAFFEAVCSFLRGADIPLERHDISVPAGYQGPS